MSCVLFNVFINDMLDDMEDVSGVVVPHGTRAQVPHSTIKTPGALFADDSVGLSPTIAKAALFCNRVTEWTATNEMQVGITKCGVLEFLPNPDRPPRLTEAHASRHLLTISNQPVPIVSEYKYLGLGLTTRLLPADLVRSRFELGRKTAMALTPFFKSPALPMSMRITVLRAVVVPRLLYGAEIYGANRALTNKMQSHLNRCLRLIAHLPNGFVPSIALWAEFRLHPICAIAASRRLRAFSKCSLLKSTIGQFVRRPLRVQKWTWSSGTTRWTKRFCRQYFAKAKDQNSELSLRLGDDCDLEAWADLPTTLLRDLVKESIAIRERELRLQPTRQFSARSTRYLRGGFAKVSLTKARRVPALGGPSSTGL